MKKMVLQQLLFKQKRNALIREQANLIANKLILEFEVNEGTRLAYFLTVPQGLDVYAYLSDVLKRLPTHKDKDIDELLPHVWKLQ